MGFRSVRGKEQQFVSSSVPDEYEVKSNSELCGQTKSQCAK